MHNIIGKKNHITYFFVLVFNICYAQKPPINFSDIQNWPVINSAAISNDGKYVIYSVQDETSNFKPCIRSIAGAFQKIIPNIGNSHSIQFSNDSRRVIYLKTNDT